MKRRAWQALAWLLYHAKPAEWRSAMNAILEVQGTRLLAEVSTPLCDLPYDTVIIDRGRVWHHIGTKNRPRIVGDE